MLDRIRAGLQGRSVVRGNDIDDMAVPHLEPDHGGRLTANGGNGRAGQAGISKGRDVDWEGETSCEPGVYRASVGRFNAGKREETCLGVSEAP